MKIFFLGLLTCFTALPTTAQQNHTDRYNKSLEDADVIIENATINISFKLNKKDQKVIVIEESEITFKSIKERADIGYPIYYDNESSVEKFKVYDEKGKNQKPVIRDQAVSSNDLFHTDFRVKYTGLVFPLKGKELTVMYEKEVFDSKYFTSIYFEEPFPIKNITYNIEIPSWFDLELKEYNFENGIITKTSKAGDAKTITFNTKNVPAAADDFLELGKSYYVPHILFLSKSYTDGNEKVTLFESTKDLYSWYKSLVDEVEIDDSTFSAKVAELTATAKTDDEKIQNIFYWVQDNIKYIAFEDGIAGFKPDAPQNVFNKRFGDCKGMAILTKYMLQKAGFDARVVWIGTDKIAYDYSTPTLSVDNHMICAVMRDNKPIFLDATEKYNKYGEFASRIQGKQSLIENGNDFILEKVPVMKVPNKEVLNATFNVNGDALNGTIDRAYFGESRVQFQNGFTYLKNDEKEKMLTKYLEAGNTHFSVSEVSKFDAEQRERELDFSHKLVVKGAVSSFDNVDYVDLSSMIPSEFFEIKEKTTDLFHPYAGQIVNTISINIPNGKTTGKLPQTISISNAQYDMELNYKVTGDKVVMESKLSIKDRLLKQADFEKWNESIKRVKDFYAEQITFK